MPEGHPERGDLARGAIRDDLARLRAVLDLLPGPLHVPRQTVEEAGDPLAVGPLHPATRGVEVEDRRGERGERSDLSVPLRVEVELPEPVRQVGLEKDVIDAVGDLHRVEVDRLDRLEPRLVKSPHQRIARGGPPRRGRSGDAPPVGLVPCNHAGHHPRRRADRGDVGLDRHRGGWVGLRLRLVTGGRMGDPEAGEGDRQRLRHRGDLREGHGPGGRSQGRRPSIAGRPARIDGRPCQPPSGCVTRHAAYRRATASPQAPYQA